MLTGVWQVGQGRVVARRSPSDVELPAVVCGFCGNDDCAISVISNSSMFAE